MKTTAVFPVPDSSDASKMSDLELYEATVMLEAEGEPDDGKLAVAWVIRNRMDAKKRGVRGIILAKWQFSCWNDDYKVQRQKRMIKVSPSKWERCCWAVCAAYWKFLPDLTFGADHYLNPRVVLNTTGRLPSWYRPEAVTTRIGQHEFLRLRQG